MIDSTPTASGGVVDKRSARTPQPVVEADAGGEAEEARQDALAQPGHGARPVAFQGEQVLAGPEDRLDALADGGQLRAAAGFVLARRPDDRGAQLGHPGRELTPGVALVAEQGLAARPLAAGEQLEATFRCCACASCCGRTARRQRSSRSMAPTGPAARPWEDTDHDAGNQ